MAGKERKTKVGKFLQTIGGGALDVVADIVSGKDPVRAILSAVTGGKMSPENAEIALAKHQEDLKDLQQARESNVRIQESENASWLAKNTAYMLDLGIFTLVVALMTALIFINIPEGNKEILYLGAGTIFGYMGATWNFHRGTSQGSQDKNQSIFRKMK
jgi:hypothetical protein